MVVKLFDQDSHKNRIRERQDAKTSQAHKDKVKAKGLRNVKKDLSK